MKLSICVPHYNESWEECKFLFDSIALQGGISFEDIEVLVGNDGNENPLTFIDFGEYPYEVTVYNFPHKGVSATRNALLDKAQGDYVMFCDCDDGFCQTYGLFLIFAKMKNEPDVIISWFIEESMQNGEFHLIRHETDMQFVHGKAYKKSFLEDKEIRFRDELLVHEDGFLNTLVATEADTFENIQNPFYVWRWRDNSVARRDREGDLFLMKTYGDLLKAREAICEELQARGFISEYFDAMAKTLIDAYYEFQKTAYLDPANARDVHRAEHQVKKFYEKYKKDYSECNIDRIAEIMHLSRTNAYKYGMRIEQVSLREWINHIAKEVK